MGALLRYCRADIPRAHLGDLVDILSPNGYVTVRRSKDSSIPSRQFHTSTEEVQGRRRFLRPPSTHLLFSFVLLGISSMLHMRMIERRRRFDPPQYRLAQSIE
ncbi:hypothetical protein J1N35_036790 [Gossypium stocksii]|uniref:Uncharacterized protein n=1 Tax=Gossypium stocksii TaxID=47602 RepID=A0A9D3ZKA1_9ROSI|nr:hypothetical protein J1N35_036790 [Gossypium stocksii]